MAMTKQEIRDSGLLELYVLGDLSQEDNAVVTDALKKYPELLDEITSIENAFKFYGKVHGVEPPEGTYSNITNEIDSKDFENEVTNASPKVQEKKQSNWSKYIWPLILLVTLASSLWFSNKLGSSLAEAEKKLLDCENEKGKKETEILLLQEITNPSNEIFLADATEKFPETKGYLHNNENTNKSFLQIQALPEIADNQSFQLWSLKGDLDPIPLNVFDANTDLIFEIQHIESTNVYAITIEPKGGQETPTLENLIATFKIS